MIQTCLSHLDFMMTPNAASGKRQHIIETAYALFKRDGLHATGVDRIIAEAGVAKMTMYRHFPSKDDLIVEVLTWRQKRFDEQLDTLAEKAATTEQKIATIFDWYETWFESPGFHGCLFQHSLAEYGTPGHPVYAAVTRQKFHLKQRMRAILEASMPGDQAENASATLLMLIEGATLLAHMGQGGQAIDGARKACGAILGNQNLQP
jgi:AcrR family transcriptional regulator